LILLESDIKRLKSESEKFKLYEITYAGALKELKDMNIFNPKTMEITVENESGLITPTIVLISSLVLSILTSLSIILIFGQDPVSSNQNSTLNPNTFTPSIVSQNTSPNPMTPSFVSPSMAQTMNSPQPEAYPVLKAREMIRSKDDGYFDDYDDTQPKRKRIDKRMDRMEYEDLQQIRRVSRRDSRMDMDFDEDPKPKRRKDKRIMDDFDFDDDDPKPIRRMDFNFDDDESPPRRRRKNYDNPTPKRNRLYKYPF
jgi:hypothetical protein